MELKELQEQMANGIKSLREAIQKRDEEIKTLGQAKEETGKKIDDTVKTLDEIKGEIAQYAKKMEEIEAQSKRLSAGNQPQVAKSLGQQFIESEEFKGQKASGTTEPFKVKKLFGKSLTSESLTTGDLYLSPSLRLDGIFYPPERPERVRDLLTVVPTSNTSVEYVVETGFVNRAATVPEFQHDDATEKPMSEITLDIQSITVKTIAHWLPIPRNVVKDVPQIRAFVDGRLIYGLKIVEDAQILYGSGAGNDILGIMNVPSIQSYLWSAGLTTDTKIDAIRRAMTLSRIAEYPVSGIVLNPQDWEDIETTKGSDGRYLMVQIPTTGADFRLWRIPVIETNAIAQGDFLLGAFNMAAALYDNEEAAIRVSESHNDFFTKNLLAILAEERIGLVVYRPEAFVKGTFDHAPTKGS